MTWRIRKNGNRTYYRSKRINGESRQIYVGTGYIAEIAAAEDGARRLQRQAERDTRRALQAEWKTADEPIRDVYGMTDLLTKATLTAAGFYLHSRSEWRRRRPD